MGFLAINVMPLRMGELVRPYLLLEKEEVPIFRSLAAVLLERLLDMSMLLILLLGVAWVVDLPSQGIELAGMDLIAAGQRGTGVLIAIGVVAGGVFVWGGAQVDRILAGLPQGERLLSFAASFRRGLSTLFEQPARACLLLGLSVAIWSLTLLGVWFVLKAFAELPASFAVAWVVWTVVLTGMTAVPTPGFFGIYELACIAALNIWAVDPTLSRTFSVVLHLGQFFFILSLGGVFLLSEGLSLKDLSKKYLLIRTNQTGRSSCNSRLPR